MPGGKKNPASQQQARLMFAAAKGSVRGGPPKAVAQEFVRGAHGTHIRNLPQRVTAKRTSMRRGSSR